ncbi:hypothetical protein [Pseudoxanthomonas putridarboris]|uniref:Outer membrane protein beta-barrel domain-containing protein n=1 Tax=Pseudoxanthomonas putridarboris TaxID=752605 RepID=A0ABU9J1Q7_9GAMM
MKSRIFVLAAAGVACGMAGRAGAIEPVDRLKVSVGSYIIEHDVDLRWDSETVGTGSDIDFHRDLGFDDSRTDVFWSLDGVLGEHHKFSAFGYRYDSGGQRLLAEDFNIHDSQFPVDAAFSGDMEVRMAGVAYTWLFHRNDRSAAGVGIGAVRYDVTADLAAAAETGEGLITAEERLDEDAWAPMLRVEYHHSLGERWRMGGQISYVKKSGGDTSGDAIDVNVHLEYFPWEHFGFGLRYNYNDADLDFERSRFTGKLNLKNQGPQVVATLRF